MRISPALITGFDASGPPVGSGRYATPGCQEGHRREQEPEPVGGADAIQIGEQAGERVTDADPDDGGHRDAGLRSPLQ